LLLHVLRSILNFHNSHSLLLLAARNSVHLLEHFLHFLFDVSDVSAEGFNVRLTLSDPRLEFFDVSAEFFDVGVEFFDVGAEFFEISLEFFEILLPSNLHSVHFLHQLLEKMKTLWIARYAGLFLVLALGASGGACSLLCLLSLFRLLLFHLMQDLASLFHFLK